MNELHLLALLAPESADAASSPDGTLIGSVIAGIVTITVALIARWQKKRRPPTLTPDQSAANLNFKNLRELHNDLRKEFDKYKEDTEKSEADYRRQVGVELAEMRAQSEHKDLVINTLDDEVLDIRNGITAGRYPPLPPRVVRPTRRLGPT